MNITVASWLHDFIIDNYRLDITEDIANEHFFNNIINFCVMETAYLLVETCKNFSITIEDLLGKTGTKLSYNSLVSAIEQLSNI